MCVNRTQVTACKIYLITQDNTMSMSGEFGNPLRKFKLVFLGEQSGKFPLPVLCDAVSPQRLLTTFSGTFQRGEGAAGRGKERERGKGLKGVEEEGGEKEKKGWHDEKGRGDVALIFVNQLVGKGWLVGGRCDVLFRLRPRPFVCLLLF